MKNLFQIILFAGCYSLFFGLCDGASFAPFLQEESTEEVSLGKVLEDLKAYNPGLTDVAMEDIEEILSRRCFYNQEVKEEVDMVLKEIFDDYQDTCQNPLHQNMQLATLLNIINPFISSDSEELIKEISFIFLNTCFKKPSSSKQYFEVLDVIKNQNQPVSSAAIKILRHIFFTSRFNNFKGTMETDEEAEELFYNSLYSRRSLRKTLNRIKQHHPYISEKSMQEIAAILSIRCFNTLKSKPVVGLQLLKIQQGEGRFYKDLNFTIPPSYEPDPNLVWPRPRKRRRIKTYLGKKQLTLKSRKKTKHTHKH